MVLVCVIYVQNGQQWIGISKHNRTELDVTNLKLKPVGKLINKDNKINAIVLNTGAIIPVKVSNNIVDISGRIIKNSQNKEVFNFGKYKNQLVSEVFKSNPEYYHWIIKSNFPEHTKKKFTEIKLREIK